MFLSEACHTWFALSTSGRATLSNISWRWLSFICVARAHSQDQGPVKLDPLETYRFRLLMAVCSCEEARKKVATAITLSSYRGHSGQQFLHSGEQDVKNWVGRRQDHDPIPLCTSLWSWDGGQGGAIGTFLMDGTAWFPSCAKSSPGSDCTSQAQSL